MQIGTTLTLQKSAYLGQKQDKYKCKIIEMNDTYIIVDYPVSVRTGKTIFLKQGTTFFAFYMDKKNNVFQFKTQIDGKTKRTIPGLILALPGEENFRRIQRRQFIRVDAAVDVAVSSSTETFSAFTTVTTDISGGGVSVVIPSTISVRENERCDICLVLKTDADQYHYVRMKAEIIRIHNRENEIHTASLNFLDIDNNDRQHIIRFCFEKQREMRRKELT